jgi:Icc-related predicted phosphoesterase
MKILSVSDRVTPELVGPRGRRRYDQFDLVFACGDLPPEYLSALRDTYDAPLLYVLGNHDIRFHRAPVGCIDLSRRLITINGLNILGFSGSRWYNGNPYQFREKEMRAQIRRLWFQLWRTRQLDVVLTHAPPRHIHDAEDRCHQGFVCYRELIRRYSPRYFIHGHIHRHFTDPSQRITALGQTTIINTYGFHIIEI